MESATENKVSRAFRGVWHTNEVGRGEGGSVMEWVEKQFVGKYLREAKEKLNGWKEMCSHVSGQLKAVR